MAKGAFDRFIIKNLNIEGFTNIYDQILYESGFQVKEKTWDGYTARHKAICGDRGSAFLLSHFTPFGVGSWMEEGNRYGAEAEINQNGPDLVLRILMVPYMSLFDKHDYFLLTQGIIEKMLDDDRCKAKLEYIVNRLMECNVEIYRHW